MHDPLAEAAVAQIQSGMLVGLGTGRAATRAIHALAHRAASESLTIECVATSRASHELGQSLGLHVRTMDDITRVDFLFDGADEVDDQHRMIKGRGGAMTRERIVAHAAEYKLYLVQRSKLVRTLGDSCALPVEVLAFGSEATRNALHRIGLQGTWRSAPDAARVMTDNANPILDIALPSGAELEDIRDAIESTPGVVGHGLFLNEADEILIESEERGTIERRTR